MAHGDLAEAAAAVGAVGAVLVLLARGRWSLLAGLAVVTAAEAALAVALVPAGDLDTLGSPRGAAALAFGAVLVAALTVLLVRRPALTLPALLVVAPFRIPVDVGSQEAFLLVPLYAVLAAAGLALAWRLLRGLELKPLPLLLAAPAAALVALASLSLLWALDPERAAIQLLFFYLPFAALAAVAARAPLPEWLPRALFGIVVGEAIVFAAIGLWQAATREVFFARDLEVANAYTTFFRVTSLFKDPSLYGRALVLAMAVVVVALWLRRVQPLAAAVLLAPLFVGLWFSYSQSSMVTLFAVVVALTLALGDRNARVAVAAATAAIVVAGGAAVGATVLDQSPRDATSGRSRLVRVTLPVIENHPLAGVGIGSQPLASREESGAALPAQRNASHTTPLTVLAELGALGGAAYLAFLAGAALLLREAVRRRRDLGWGLAAAFATLLLHSLFYAGFFEDAILWLSLAVAAGVVSTLPRPVEEPAKRPQEPRRAPAPVSAE